MKEILKNKWLLLVSFICISLDQIIKIIVSKMPLYSSIKIINNFFYITYVKNDGAAWNILSGGRIILVLIATIVIYLIYDLLIKNQKLDKEYTILYGMLYGGIIGNLFDRIVHGYVVDYLDFYILKYNFPVFNLADSLIVLSVIFLIIKLIRGDKRANKNR